MGPPSALTRPIQPAGRPLGYLWTQIAPLMLMAVFWVVFSFFFRSDIAMFPVFLIVGLLVWNFCAEAVVGGSRSVTASSQPKPRGPTFTPRSR